MNIRIFSILAILIVCSSIFTQSIPPALAQAPAINNLTQPDSVSADDDDNNNNKRTIKPSEDAYVNNDNQSSNYGKSKYLKVSRNNDSYLKFKVSDSVKKATLRLYLVSGRSKSVSVYSTSTSWSEKKITWKNRPKAKDKLDTSSAKSKYIEFDVTDGVKKGTISFVLKGDSSNFYSRDGKKDPELIVNGSGSSPETTPKPTKTPRPGDPNPTDEPNPTDGPNPTDEPEPTDNPNPTDPPIGGGPCEPGFDCEPDSTPDPNDPGPGDECNTTIDCDNDGEPGIGNNFPTPTPGASAANRPTNTPTSVPGGATNPPGGSTGTIAPDANTKIAYIGDTADGQNHKNVLKMIHAENASAIVHLGDLSYGSDVVNFEKNITAEFGPSFPHFIAKGNHDGSSLWTQAIGHMNTRNALTGLFQLSGSPSTYDFVFKGIKFGISEGGNPATITSQFASDNHIWKVCGWHYNMQWIQIGGKGDEAEWASYNNCRQYGAMVVMGHEHSYERTKTLTKYPSDTSANAADLIATGDAANLTVSRGSNFSVVSGAGGTGMRDQERCNSTSETAGGCNIWASIRTSTQGATFGAMIITYNPGGNRPREAEGIYKEVTGNTGVGTVTDRFTIRAN
jgi:predicted phosphodiesterase